MHLLNLLGTGKLLKFSFKIQILNIFTAKLKLSFYKFPNKFQLLPSVLLCLQVKDMDSAVAYGKADHSKCNLCKEYFSNISHQFLSSAHPGHCEVAGSEQSHEIQTLWQPKEGFDGKQEIIATKRPIYLYIYILH